MILSLRMLLHDYEDIVNLKKKKCHVSTEIIIILFVFNFFIRFRGFR